MKYLLLFLLFPLSICQVSAQNPVKEKLYATSLNDTVEYTVYLPADWEGWDYNTKHPTIYAINYGMMNGDYLAAQISYFRKARYAMPNSVIVVINASMERMGYSYDTGLLSKEGLHFVDFMKKELIPVVEKKYNTSAFRTYIGHSFASSFGNYIFLNDPGMFNGYILLAPEKIGAEHPPFHLSANAKAYYNHAFTFYYAAVGENDLPRRRDYAKEIKKEVAQLDTTKFFFRYDSLARTNHTNILTMAIEFAAEHVYQFYTPYSGKDEKDVVKDLQAVTGRIKEMYGIEPEKNFTFYSPFVHEALTNKDSAGLVSVLDYFNNNRLKGWNLMQFGSFCLQLKLKDKARNYFEQAIEKITREEMGQEIGPPNLMACYNYLAFNIYDNEPEKGWAYLQQALALAKTNNKYVPKDGEAYYNLGKFSAINNYKVQEGLQYLQTYLLNETGAANDMANYYTAKNYMLLNQPQKAKPYLQKAIKENSNNKEAAELLKQLD